MIAYVIIGAMMMLMFPRCVRERLVRDGGLIYIFTNGCIRILCIEIQL